MNVVIVNLEGKSPRYGTFDLYGKDSTELKEFLSKVEVGELVMVASYDDAAFRSRINILFNRFVIHNI